MVSAVFCHHKGELLDEALRTVLNSKGVEFEVIVVTSMYLTNPVIEGMMKKYPLVRFIQQDGGPDVKRNHGAKFAHGNLIAFFDDDIEVEREGSGSMSGGLIDNSCKQSPFHVSRNSLSWAEIAFEVAGGCDLDE